MPELPEVQTIVNDLRPHAVGAAIARVVVLRADFVQPSGVRLPHLLAGRTVINVHRRGKRIIFTLDNQQRFLIHLGMTGRVTLEPVATPLRLHTHVVIQLRRTALPVIELHLCDPRRFGWIEWLGNTDGEQGLGIEPADLTPARLAKLLRATRRPIKALLLDQRAIAGLGNIYADESLFAAGIHPQTPGCEIPVPGVRRLCAAIKDTLAKAIRHRGSTLRDYVDAAGGKGTFQKLHHVYGRAGLPCRKCRAVIAGIRLAGRSTCFCPECQPQLPV